jgi:hypothetical protein
MPSVESTHKLLFMRVIMVIPERFFFLSQTTVSGLLFGRSGQAVHEAGPFALYADCAVI